MTISRSVRILLPYLAVVLSLWLNPIFAQDPQAGRVLPGTGSAPPPAPCGFEGAFEKKMEDPGFRLRQEQVERNLYETARRLLEHRNTGRSTAPDEILTIPLVIHIIHLSSEPNPGDGPSNPTDEQIRAGIEHLNDAFRNTGAFAGNGRQSLAALQSVDVAIEFCLAQRDINGNPSTGILRYANDNYSNMDMEDDDPEMQQWVAGQNGNAYPGSDYANIWLVNQICSSGSSSCNIAGYAYFPGNHGSVSNGIINLTRYWGSSTNNSKVHIHEFGHYLSLYHTFQGGCDNGDCLSSGDRICDTPPDASTSYSSCGADENSCTTDADAANSPFQTDVGDLYENYMDYSSSNCQNTFTEGQKQRMRATLLGARGSLLNSQGCIPVDGAEAGLVRIIAPDQSLCSTSFTPVVAVASNGNQPITSLEFGLSLDGVAQPNVSWNGTIAPGQSSQITLEPLSFTGTGSHSLQIEILTSNGVPDPFLNNNIQTKNFQYAAPLTNLPFCEDLESGSPTPDWVISNPDDDIGFETYQIGSCNENGNYVLGLQTWAEFPSGTTVEDLLTQSIDLSNASNVSLHFDVAYATYYSNFNTILEISVSTDCGLSYTTLYEKTGNSLSTARRPADNARDPDAFFIPADCSEWKSESIDLEAYTGQQILLRIRAKTGDVANSNFGYYWGNNLYLDNICILGEGTGGSTGGTDCTTEELELINNSIPSGDYDNVGMIIAAQELETGAVVNFSASESIVLLPGFSVDGNAVFQARIEPCTEPTFREEEAAVEPQMEAVEVEHNFLALQVAPNPFSDQTRISFSLPEHAVGARLDLVDMTGSLLRSLRIDPGGGSHQQIFLDRGDLPAGVFLLVLRHDGGQLIRKLMVIGN